MSATGAPVAPAGARSGPLDPIVLACDFSGATPGAVRAAAALARLFGVGVVALHVTPTRLPASRGFHALPNPVLLRPRLHEDIARALAGAVQPACAAGVAVRAEQREGKPADEILAACRAMAAGLVVVGTHGRRAVDRALLGSVAETVLRQAVCPVLTVPPAFVERGAWPRTVLWASGLPHADVARACAAEIAVRAGATLVPAAGVTAREILDRARGCGADLVVLATLAPRRFARMRPPPATLALVRAAACPVLVVPGAATARR